jgi:hydroxyacylglutathione hydrolase
MTSHHDLQIVALPAFNDNYIWLLRHHQYAAVVDPGDAAPVIAYLQQHQLKLSAILITHHHSDHIDGVASLIQHYAPQVYASGKEKYTFAHQAVVEGQTLHLDNLQLTLKVLEVPGHTLGHVAYYGANCLFCGDTLFAAGCGRLFEGSAEQLYASLQRLAQLPDTTAVYCTHEYTLRNLEFALSLSPNYPPLLQRQATELAKRQSGLPTLPSTIALELATNPFLRCSAVFAAIRNMRNLF